MIQLLHFRLFFKLIEIRVLKKCFTSIFIEVLYKVVKSRK
jgi:hypothetical protein